METKIFKVIRQSEAFAVQSSKSENGQTKKCSIVLQEMGGKYENQYFAVMLGNMATCRLAEGDIIAATLRFTTRDYNGQTFQDILMTDFVKISPNVF